jgi:hypothetical protein
MNDTINTAPHQLRTHSLGLLGGAFARRLSARGQNLILLMQNLNYHKFLDTLLTGFYQHLSEFE